MPEPQSDLAGQRDASGAYPFPVLVADLLVGEHVVDDQLGVRKRPGRAFAAGEPRAAAVHRTRTR